MICISAQPDTLYFHWQVEIQLYQFSKHNIENCHVLFGYETKPSAKGLELALKYPGQIHHYKDERTSDQRVYVPSIRPHLLKKFFSEFPELGKAVFYHDSDIFLVHPPDFNSFLTDDIGYLSDTISYIGYNYLTECSSRYTTKYPELPKNDLLLKMISIFGIEEDVIKQNQSNSGGAQYLLKNLDSAYWEEVETCSNTLYKFLKQYEKDYPVDHHVQSWTTDMWAVLWCYWKRGKTVVHKSFDFSWATSTVKEYFERPIFHLAGVTNTLEKTHFFKGAYINKNIFSEYKKNPSIFDYISPTNATYEYIKVVKEYVDGFTTIDPNITKFLLKTDKHYSDIYVKTNTVYFGESLWKSHNEKYIIFFNHSKWILTASQYENEINETCGGFLCGTGPEPYECVWNDSVENVLV